MHEICKDLSPSSQCDLSTDQVCVGLSQGHRHMLSKKEYGGGAGSGTCWVQNLISHIICETRAIHECIIKCVVDVVHLIHGCIMSIYKVGIHK